MYECNASSQSIDSSIQNYTIEDEPPLAKILGAQFIMKTRDGKRLTQVAVDGIIFDTKVVLDTTLNNVEKKVLENVTMTDEQKKKLKTIFSDESITNPFQGLETQYKQQSFIEEHFNFVVTNYHNINSTSKHSYDVFRCLLREFWEEALRSGRVLMSVVMTYRYYSL